MSEMECHKKANGNIYKTSIKFIPEYLVPVPARPHVPGAADDDGYQLLLYNGETFSKRSILNFYY